MLASYWFQSTLGNLSRIVFFLVNILTVNTARLFTLSSVVCLSAKADNVTAGKPSDVHPNAGSQNLLQRRLNLLLNKAYDAHKAAHGQEAIGWCNQALKIEPNCGKAYELRGWSLNDLEEPTAAIKDLKRALQLKNVCGNVYGQLARAQLSCGQRKEAIENYSNAFKQDHCTVWLEDRAKIHILEKDYSAAISDAALAIKNSPKSAAGYQVRASAYFAIGDYNKAINDYSQAIAIRKDPVVAAVYASRAAAYRKIGRNDLAAADQKKADAIARTFE